MTIERDIDLHLTRRQLFGLTARGIGAAALGSLLSPELLAASALQDARDPKTGGLGTLPHFAPKAKRVIFLHQSGGPSQLETFDYKPGLAKFQGTQIPDSIRQGQRVTQTMGQSLLAGGEVGVHSLRSTARAGTWVSELLPHTAKIVDDISRHQVDAHRRDQPRSRRSRSSRPAASSRAGRAWARGSLTGSAARTRICRRSS